MIAIDTNVLLRYLLRDDEVQAERSRRVIACGERVLITDVVLAETVWTLSGCRYRATRADLIDLVNSLLQDANLALRTMRWSGALQHIAGRGRLPTP